jgi:hypothetical protein
MLFAVTLTYLTQHDVISAHLDAHKRWLARGLSERRIIFAGLSVMVLAVTYFFMGTKSATFITFSKMTPLSFTTLQMQKS